jgi:hypothetical protein
MVDPVNLPLSGRWSSFPDQNTFAVDQIGPPVYRTHPGRITRDEANHPRGVIPDWELLHENYSG